MFKLIVLTYAFYGTNGAPVILNENDLAYQTYRYERRYFNSEESCSLQGEAYVDAAKDSDGSKTVVKFMCAPMTKEN